MRILLPGNLTKKTFEYSFNRPVAARDSLTREGFVTCTVTAPEFEFRQLFYCQFEKTYELVIPQFEFKLPPPKQTQEELFGSFVVHGW
jgi:hypothetical protein